jgi:hypothetical protein
LRYYKARFQIEFLFRDAKQFTGLNDHQVRDQKKLDFHLNLSLTALNLLPVFVKIVVAFFIPKYSFLQSDFCLG